MSKAHDEDVRKRNDLLMLYTETQKTLGKLDPQKCNFLEKDIGNVKVEMEKKLDELKQKEYFVLVAGKCEGIQPIIYTVTLLNLI